MTEHENLKGRPCTVDWQPGWWHGTVINPVDNTACHLIEEPDGCLVTLQIGGGTVRFTDKPNKVTGAEFTMECVKRAEANKAFSNALSGEAEVARVYHRIVAGKHIFEAGFLVWEGETGNSTLVGVCVHESDAIKLCAVAPTQTWISVDERLPEKDGVVLVYSPTARASEQKPFIYSAWYNPDFGWSMLAPYWIQAITHWMPLPAAPEVNESETN